MESHLFESLAKIRILLKKKADFSGIRQRHQKAPIQAIVENARRRCSGSVRMKSHGLFGDRTDPIQLCEAVTEASHAFLESFDDGPVHPSRKKPRMTFLPE